MDSVPVRRECREGGEAGDTGSLGNVNVEKCPQREARRQRLSRESPSEKISRSEPRAHTHVTVCTSVYYWSTHTSALGGPQRPKIHECGISRNRLTLKSSHIPAVSAVVAVDWL